MQRVAATDVYRPVHHVDDGNTPLPIKRHPEMVFCRKNFLHHGVLSLDFLNAVFSGGPVYAFGYIEYVDVPPVPM